MVEAILNKEENIHILSNLATRKCDQRLFTVILQQQYFAPPPLLSPSSWCPGGVGEHVALQHQRWILPVDEAEKCRSGRGAVQTGATTTRSPHPEPPVR